MREVVGWLPVVEGLIAILYGREECTCEVCSEEYVECLDGLNGKRRGRSKYMVDGD